MTVTVVPTFRAAVRVTRVDLDKACRTAWAEAAGAEAASALLPTPNA